MRRFEVVSLIYLRYSKATEDVLKVHYQKVVHFLDLGHVLVTLGETCCVCLII